MPYEFIALVVSFAPLFSKPVFQHAQVLLMGAILAPGKRTVTSALRVMGLSQDAQFQNYHRVLIRVVSLNSRDEVLSAEFHKIRGSQRTQIP